MNILLNGNGIVVDKGDGLDDQISRGRAET